MRTAFKLMQLKYVLYPLNGVIHYHTYIYVHTNHVYNREREESGFQWVKRPKRERQIPLGELKLGERYEGVVITVKEHGCYVDFGAKRDGFVRLRVCICVVEIEGAQYQYHDHFHRHQKALIFPSFKTMKARSLRFGLHLTLSSCVY